MKPKIISKLCLYDEVNQKDVILQFQEGMNILVGSKGGGKSTLVNILHYLHNKSSLDKPFTTILNEHHLKIRYIEYSNGEKILYENLEKLKPSDNDIIKQDDKIKTAMSDLDVIKKDMEDFAGTLINNNASWFIKLVTEYQSTFLKISNIRKTYSLNWNLLNSFKTTDEKLTMLKHNLFEKISSNNTLKCDNIILYSLLSIYISKLKEFDHNLFKENQEILTKLLDIHNTNSYEDLFDLKIKNQYNSIMSDIKRELNESNNLNISVTNFKRNTKTLFESLASELAKNYILFKELNNPFLSINFKGEKKTYYDMLISINEEINLNDIENPDEKENTWVISILSQLLYKPNNKLSLWTNWLEKSYKEQNYAKDKEPNKIIISELRSKIRDYVKLLADGKDYNQMSLGTRTSFGIKQKIKSFKESILFLDQPEDNLDNYTIFNELIKIFNKPNKQYFMVTHNSNFGTLTNPQVITTCSLNKDNPGLSYIQRFDILKEIEIPSESMIKDSPIRHYLEGGNESLEQRYKKLRKDN